MNEPKKRGRPSKAEIAARNARVEGGEVIGVREAIQAEALIQTRETFEVADMILSASQAYAERVWHGQSISADRAWRIQRVKEALEGQGLSFEGVVLP